MTRSLMPGEAVHLAPGIQRLVAPNPGMMTGPGTNTYVLGERELTVIDPGPAMGVHVDAIVELADGRLRRILVTHTHTDHSPAAALLAGRTGAELLGRPAPPGRHQDSTFVPDRVLADGDVVTVDSSRVRVLHTPGHASNHLCYLHDDTSLLFTGDHIINGSTVVIDPPDGDMHDYLESLRRLQREPARAIAPGHGDVIEDPPAAIGALIEHRLERERLVAVALQDHPGGTSRDLVPVVYAGIGLHLQALAERSLLAHLLKLARDGLAEESGGCWRATAPL